MSLPPQPILVDDHVTVRAWRDADIEPARLAHDEEMACRFGFPAVIPSVERMKAWVDEMRRAYADGRRIVAFAIEVDGRPVGAVDVKDHGDNIGALSWAVYAPYRGRGIATRAVRLVVRYAFGELAMERVEAYVEPDNIASYWTAIRAGMRPEGVLRGRETLAGRRRDNVVLARLRDDPDPSTRAGRIGLANAWLPLKRVVAKAVVRDEDARILMTQGPYGGGWDLPGGVVERAESPRLGAVREVQEELDLDLTDSIGELLLVDWLPCEHGWDDACLLVFDGGTHDSSILDTMTLQATEIGAVEWVDPGDVPSRALLPMARCLPCLLVSGSASRTGYLEHHERAVRHPARSP